MCFPRAWRGSPWRGRGSLTGARRMGAEPRSWGRTRGGRWMVRERGEREKNCEFLGPQLGGEQCEPGQTTTPDTKDRKSPPFSPDPSLSQDPCLGQRGPHLKGLGYHMGAAEAACATSVPRAGCGLHCHLPIWSSWVG